MKKYIAFFEYDNNDGYSVVFPDLPGLATAGDDYDDAYRMAHEALAFHLEGLAEENFFIPEPRTLEKIKKEWSDWDEWEKNYKFMVVPISVFSISKEFVHIDVMFPEKLLYHIDAVSNNRSAFLINAAEHMLGTVE
jgi:predicted RNase H-like HicB family nuclease